MLLNVPEVAVRAPVIPTVLANVAAPVTPNVLLSVAVPVTVSVLAKVAAPVTPRVLLNVPDVAVRAPVIPTVLAKVAAPTVLEVPFTNSVVVKLELLDKIPTRWLTTSTNIVSTELKPKFTLPVACNVPATSNVVSGELVVIPTR